MMKRVWNVAKYSLLAVLSLGTFAWVTYYYDTGGSSWYGRDYEKVCYAVWALALVVCCAAATKRMRALWKKLLAGGATALTYTAVVFLANNFWRHIEIHSFPGMDTYIPFSDVMRWDATFTYGSGGWRYPMVFALMLLLCVLAILWQHFHFHALCCRGEEAFFDWLADRELRKRSLEDIYGEGVEEVYSQQLVKYVSALPQDNRHKEQMMAFVDRHNDVVLIELLLMHYRNLLTLEEYSHYRAKYLALSEAYIEEQKTYYSMAKAELPPICRWLDRKFDLEDEGEGCSVPLCDEP